jgi:hypothetical protein
MRYTVDYTQDENGRWRSHTRPTDGTRWIETSPPRLTIEDCVADVYDSVGDDAELEVGDVREHPAHGLFGAEPFPLEAP